MSALSDYAENKVLDAIGANATFTTPSAVYLGLSTGSFNDDGSGTEISDFAITGTGLTSFIKLSRFNVSANHVDIVWGGTDDQIITATGTGQNSVYGNNGEPPIGDLPAGFTGCCRIRTKTSEGFVFLEFIAGN